MSKTIIISPSGKGYGSEKVLTDYLNKTNYSYYVYIPKNSFFDKNFNGLVTKIHTKYQFTSLYNLYCKVLIQLLLNKNIKTVYVNEGGHIKWISILATIFKSKKFIIHIRLLEDTSWSRVKKALPKKNIKLIAVSHYIASKLTTKNEVLYDPFQFSHRRNVIIGNRKNIAIIGRVTPTKGFMDAYSFISTTIKQNSEFSFSFIGDIDPIILNTEEYMKLTTQYKENVQFCGYIEKHEELYKNIDIVMHFNPNEALGRVYLEAINRGIPFYGFNEGGISEISRVCNLEEYLVSKEDNWQMKLYQKITDKKLLNNERNIIARGLATKNFNIESYVSTLDALITQ